MMPIPICRKGRRLEKVENSTALHACRMILLTSEQIRSRLRYRLLITCNYFSERRATQDNSIQCQEHDQPQRYAVAPATRDSSGMAQAAASRMISDQAVAAHARSSQSVAGSQGLPE